jgi:hypothetical protein
MRPALVLLAASGFAAGCTPVQWVKPDATPAQYQQDYAQCRNDAWREAYFRSWMYRPLSSFAGLDPLGRHYLFWPAGPFGDPYGDAFIEETRLADFCMRAKGYQLEAIEPAKKAPAAG